MYDGYFALGGREIGNSPRAVGLQATSDCPVQWLDYKNDACDTLAEALGDDPYVFGTIETAPWYDPDNVERSERILGLSIVSMSGIQDDTRQATMQEKVTKGAHIGRTRRGGRQVRVSALLTARGEDALDAGMTWLRGALDARECGTHGPGCQLADFEFFTSCPPERGVTLVQGAPTLAATNLMTNPSAEVSLANISFMNCNPVQSAVWAADGTKSVEIRSNNGSPDCAIAVGGDLGGMRLGMQAGKTYTVSGTIRLAAPQGNPADARARRISVMHRIGGAAFTYVNSTAAPNAAGATRLSVTFTLPVGTTEALIRFYNGSGDFNDVVFWDAFSLYEGSDAGYFDGNTPDTVENIYAWTGTAGLSTSTLSVGEITETVQTDLEYAATVDEYRRYLHDVKVISGPYIIEELKSRKYPGYVGNVVEFTIGCEVPEIYTKPREISLTPSVPEVINDVPFNFMQQPRPSSSITPRVVAIKNMSPNPSLEVDATGWSAAVASISGSAPAAYFTSGRVTGELAAVGLASHRGRILGNGSTTASGQARITTSTPDIVLDNANERMSFNVWAAAVSVGGATGAGLVSVTVKVEWRTNSATINTVTLATSTVGADIAGKSFSAVGVKPPATATIARITVEHVVNWSSNATPASNSDIRVYVDAVAPTVP